MDIIELGARLRQQREKLGFSLEEVADSTKISKHILLAFEEGDRDNFPHRVYAKGFVQSYAKVLGLDPCEFGEAMKEALRPCDDTAVASARPVICEPSPPRNWRILLGMVSLAVLLGVLVWYFFFSPEPAVAPEGFASESSRSAADDQNGAALVNVPAVTAMSAGASAAVSAGDDLPLQTAPQEMPSAPEKPDFMPVSVGDVPPPAPVESLAATVPTAPAPVSGGASAAPAAQEASATQPAAVPAVGPRLLRIVAVDDKGSWVGVWIPGRQHLFQSLNVNKRRTVDIDVSERRRFKFGRVEGVTVTFDGKPLDLGKAGIRTIYLPAEP